MASAYAGTIRKIIISTLTLPEGFSDEEKEEIIDFLEDNCLSRIHIDILDSLSKENRDEFYRINEHRDPAKIKAFLEEKLPNYMDLIQNSTRKTIQEFNRSEAQKE